MILSSIQTLQKQKKNKQTSFQQIKSVFLNDCKPIQQLTNTQTQHRNRPILLHSFVADTSPQKNITKSNYVQKLKSLDIKAYSIRQKLTMSQCNGLRVDSQCIKSTSNRTTYKQKMNELRQKLPQIYLNHAISRKKNLDQENIQIKLSNANNYRGQIQQKQKQIQLNNSKKVIVDNLFPNLQDKNSELTNYSQTLSPEYKQFPLNNKGYLSHDLTSFYYFAKYKNNIENESNFLRSVYPNITAQNFCILNSQNLQFILCKNKISQQQLQIASLSKIVTCYLTILICKKYMIDMKTYKCRVSSEAVQMPGTSAELQPGDCLSIQELLYGLMLPSGNDAAVALSQNLGKYLQKQKKKPSKLTPIKIFLKHMNIIYKQMLLETNTNQHNFQNPSGLPHNPNKTTITQITIFAAVAMQNSIFKKIVSTKQYELNIKNQRYGLIRKILWKNTNKLLWIDGWQGVKTGTTDTAGHCFIGKFNKYIVSIFDCESLSKRFNEALILMKWLQEKNQSLDI